MTAFFCPPPPPPPRVRAVASLGMTSVQGSQTIAWPDVKGGDLVIFMDFNVQTPRSAPIVPAGFEPLVINGDSADFNPRLVVSCRICDGTETGNITGLEIGGGTEKIPWHMRGEANTRIREVKPVGFAAQMTNGNPTAINQGASAGAAPLVVVAGVRNGSTSNFSAQLPAFAHTRVQGPCRLSGTIYNTDPQDHIIDASDGGVTNMLFSGYLEIR